MVIKELSLFTNNINRQEKFYSDKLGLKIIQPDIPAKVSFMVGDSKLNFIERPGSTPYHFAINIYSNLEEEALTWLKERVNVLTFGSDEIHDFESWNARAVYFYDADKNIVELIARKNLGSISQGKFSINSLLNISEIGCPVESIEEIYNKLNNEMDLQIYSGSFDEFCAVGDETGLFICVDRNKKKWFPAGDVAYPSEFSAVISAYNKYYRIKFVNGKINITAA